MKKTFFDSKRFVLLMAGLSGISAMGIDSVLPIFPDIIRAFALPDASHNRVQQVVFIFMLGFASLQIVFGILADRFGRKVVLISGLVIYILASLSVFFIHSFEQLLLLRFIQGAGLAAPRVLTMTIVRDRVEGAAMSRIMSFVMMVFLIIPIIAPMIGQTIVIFAPWQGVFVLLAVFGLGLLTWVAWELPETLSVEDRQPLNGRKLISASQAFIHNRHTQIYLLMTSLLFGMLMTYVGLSEQILQKDVYQLGELFPIFFAMVVTGMLAASLINARFVVRWGMQKMVIIALIMLLCTDSLLFFSIIISSGIIPLWAFIVLMIGHFMGFGLAMPNLNALMMQPYKAIAGTASALIGTITTFLGVGLAQCISYFFDKTLYCIGVGFILGTLLLWILFFIQRQVATQ